METQPNLKEVFVNASQIEMLFKIGDKQRVKDLMNGNRKIPITSVSEILPQKTRSFDPRFDKLIPVEMVCQSLFDNGLPKSILSKVLNSKSCIKNRKLTGAFVIFYELLSEENLKFIQENLDYKHNYIYKEGNGV